MTARIMCSSSPGIRLQRRTSQRRFRSVPARSRAASTARAARSPAAWRAGSGRCAALPSPALQPVVIDQHEAAIAGEPEHAQQLRPVDRRVAAVLLHLAEARVDLHGALQRRIEARLVGQVGRIEADAQPRRADIAAGTDRVQARCPTSPARALFCSATTTPRSAPWSALCRSAHVEVGPGAARVRLRRARTPCGRARRCGPTSGSFAAGAGVQPAKMRTMGAPSTAAISHHCRTFSVSSRAAVVWPEIVCDARRPAMRELQVDAELLDLAQVRRVRRREMQVGKLDAVELHLLGAAA